MGQRHFLLILVGHEQKKVENPWPIQYSHMI